MSNWSQYQKPNVGLLFYKHIYKEQDIITKIDTRVKSNNERELFIAIPDNNRASPFDDYYKDLLRTTTADLMQIESIAFAPSFTLYTTYPGLLTGSGYQHDTKARGDFKIGFFFDHTTGQPVIPGSSIKGILRSLFELDIPEKGKACTGQKSVDAIKFICDEIIDSTNKNEAEREKWALLKSQVTIENLVKLKTETFGDGADTGGKKMGRDIFYDAVINVDKTGIGKRIFSNDFITPHPDPLKNPNPIQFLKVMPNVAFDFKFALHDVDEWTKEMKQTLFKQILLTLGAGAKTNVGYGQLSENKMEADVIVPEQRRPDAHTGKRGDRSGNYLQNREQKPEYNPQSRFENIPPPPVQAEKERPSDQWPDIADVKVKQGSITAKVILIEGVNLTVQPYIRGLADGQTIKITLNKYDERQFQKGEPVQIQLTVKTGRSPNFVLQGKILTK